MTAARRGSLAPRGGCWRRSESASGSKDRAVPFSRSGAATGWSRAASSSIRREATIRSAACSRIGCCARRFAKRRWRRKASTSPCPLVPPKSSATAPAFASRWRMAASLQQRSEEHTSELQSLMRISYAVFCLKKKNKHQHTIKQHQVLKLHHHNLIKRSHTLHTRHAHYKSLHQ